MFTPASNWKVPTELPDLRGRPLVVLDTETKDDGLNNQRGPGWATKAGKIVGVAWATDDDQAYIPLEHPETSGCFPRENVSRWLQDLVASKTPLGFQNAPYDVGWLFGDLGVDIPPEYPIEDALCMSFMLDENHYEYNLDAICAREGMPGKDETLLREAAIAYLRPANALKSWKLTNPILKANLWRLPARYVGVYAEQDGRSTIDVIRKMAPRIAEQKLTDAYRLEMDLVPTVRRMRSRGIRIDTDLCDSHRERCRSTVAALLAEIKRDLPPGHVRGEVTMEHLRSTKFLNPVFEAEGIRVPRTAPTKSHPEGQPSYSQDWMEKHEKPLARNISKALRIDRFGEVFLGDFILGFTVAERGTNFARLHAEVHQYKSDEGGTVSYRFAYSAPPLQQAPSADKGDDLGKMIGTMFRDVFIAEGVWGANDYSQQEYRLTAHFAAKCKVRGGLDAAEMYSADADLDFHKMVAGMAGIPRGRAKILNFALLYGQGLDSTAEQLGISVEDAKELRDNVAGKAPFGPALDDYCKRTAQQFGYLQLLDGARVRFDEWEVGWVDREEYKRGLIEGYPMTPCTHDEMMQRRIDPKHPWHGCQPRRAGVRKALNRLIQGSAARQTKKAIRECARAKLFPILQMHDELDHDEPSEKNIYLVAQIMREVVPLLVPMKVDTGIGHSWAAAKAKDAPAPQQQPLKAPTDAGGHGLMKAFVNKP